MALKIDESKCIGCGLCVNLCPDCFEADGDIVRVIAQTCDDCDLDEISTQCPVEAILID